MCTPKRGESRESLPKLIAAVDSILDMKSPIYSYHRKENQAAHNLALALHAECEKLWRDGGGQEIQKLLLDAGRTKLYLAWQLMSIVRPALSKPVNIQHQLSFPALAERLRRSEEDEEITAVNLNNLHLWRIGDCCDFTTSFPNCLRHLTSLVSISAGCLNRYV
jgi:hypothetical protein